MLAWHFGSDSWYRTSFFSAMSPNFSVYAVEVAARSMLRIAELDMAISVLW